jgi:hypothetical protein
MVAAQVFRLNAKSRQPIYLNRDGEWPLTFSWLWRLATVTGFSAGPFSPLGGVSWPSRLPFFPNALFMCRFSCEYFHTCLAPHSQSVP